MRNSDVIMSKRFEYSDAVGLGATLLTLLASCGITLVLYFNATEFEQEIANLQHDWKNFNSSLSSQWRNRQLSGYAKRNIEKEVRIATGRCDSPAPPFGNVESTKCTAKRRYIVDTSAYVTVCHYDAAIYHVQRGNPKQAVELYLKARRPAGHVIADKETSYKLTKNERMVTIWSHLHAGTSHLCSGVVIHNNSLQVPESGYYYVYSQLTFTYSDQGSPSLHRHVTYRAHNPKRGYSKESPLFENSYYLGKSLTPSKKTEEQVSHQSGVIKLLEGDRVFVMTQGPPRSSLVLRDSDTYFGLYLIP